MVLSGFLVRSNIHYRNKMTVFSTAMYRPGFQNIIPPWQVCVNVVEYKATTRCDRQTIQLAIHYLQYYLLHYITCN